MYSRCSSFLSLVYWSSNTDVIVSMPAQSTATYRSNSHQSCLWSSWSRTSSRMVALSAMFAFTRFVLAMGPEWKYSSCATYLILSWARMRGRHPYVPPHFVVIDVLATFAISVVRTFMDPEVGCPTILVKVASPNVVFTIEVIDSVVLLDIFDLFLHLVLASDRIFGSAFSSGSFWIGYHIFWEVFNSWI